MWRVDLRARTLCVLSQHGCRIVSARAVWCLITQFARTRSAAAVLVRDDSRALVAAAVRVVCVPYLATSLRARSRTDYS